MGVQLEASKEPLHMRTRNFQTYVLRGCTVQKQHSQSKGHSGVSPPSSPMPSSSSLYTSQPSSVFRRSLVPLESSNAGSTTGTFFLADFAGLGFVSLAGLRRLAGPDKV